MKSTDQRSLTRPATTIGIRGRVSFLRRLGLRTSPTDLSEAQTYGNAREKRAVVIGEIHARFRSNDPESIDDIIGSVAESLFGSTDKLIR